MLTSGLIGGIDGDVVLALQREGSSTPLGRAFQKTHVMDYGTCCLKLIRKKRERNQNLGGVLSGPSPARRPFLGEASDIMPNLTITLLIPWDRWGDQYTEETEMKLAISLTLAVLC